MELFHIIEDCFVILRSRGVYRQAKVYRRGTSLFAGWGGGFVRLCGSGGTSSPNVLWDAVSPNDDIGVVERGIGAGSPIFIGAPNGERTALPKPE